MKTMKTKYVIIAIIVIAAVIGVYLWYRNDQKKKAAKGGPSKDTGSSEGWLSANWELLQKIGNLPDPPPKGFTKETYEKANEDQKNLIDPKSFDWLESIASGARGRGTDMKTEIKKAAEWAATN